VEDDVLQRRCTAREAVLAVLVPEKFCVRQPRPQHALVPGDDLRAAIRRLHIGDAAETPRKRAVGGQQGEIFLMRPHRRGKELGGQHRRRGLALLFRDDEKEGAFLGLAGLALIDRLEPDSAAGTVWSDSALSSMDVGSTAAVNKVEIVTAKLNHITVKCNQD
jgi:hypothetical protein